MGFLLMILDLLEYMLLTLAVKGISSFLNITGILIICFLVISLSIYLFYKGIRGYLSRQSIISIGKQVFRPVNLCFLSFMLLVSTVLIEGKNIILLAQNDRSTSVYALIKGQNTVQKSLAEYNSKFKVDKYNNITILYKSDLKPAIPLVYEFINKVDGDCVKLFGDLQQSPLEVKFDYDEKMFKSLKSTKEDYAGLYSHKDRRVNIYIGDCYEDILALNMKSSNFKHVIFHEYGHYMVDEYLEHNNISSESIPLWFYEGMGEYIGWEGPNGYPPKVIVDFKEITDDKGWMKYFDNDYDIYEQSHFAVSELIMLKGEEVVKELLSKTKLSNFDAAFEDIMGFSIEEYQSGLQADMKSGWKKYYRMIVPFKNVSFEVNTRISCLEEYINTYPDNINALLDLDILYRNVGQINKAKNICASAVEKTPENSMAWHRLALISEELSDFNTALMAFQKVVDLDSKNSNSYINLAQVLLLTDLSKAVTTAEKAKYFDNSNYVTKQILEIITFKSLVDAGKPYEGCLRLIKSDTILSNKLKKELIQRNIKEYPNLRCEARTELEKLAIGLK